MKQSLVNGAPIRRGDDWLTDFVFFNLVHKTVLSSHVYKVVKSKMNKPPSYKATK
jgi:hypothetical protein